MLMYKFKTMEDALVADETILADIKEKDSLVKAEKWSDIIENNGFFLILIPTEYGLSYNYEKYNYEQPQPIEE